MSVDVPEQPNQPDRAGQGGLQVRAQLVGHRDPGRDQVRAGSHRHPQRDCCRRVHAQRPQPRPISAHGVSQHERVEPVVLVAGRAVAATQATDPVRGDHQHGQTGGQQRVDDRPVRTFDPDLDDAGTLQPTRQPTRQPPQPGRGVLDGEPVEFSALMADHRDRVRLTGPVDPRRRSTGGSTRADVLGDTHRVLLAVDAAGGHPVAPGHDSRSLTDRRSHWRAALSPVRVSWATGPRETSCRTSKVKRTRRWPGGDQGCTGNHISAGRRSLPNQSPTHQRLDQ